MRRSAAIVGGARVGYRVQGRGTAIVLVNGTAALDMHWGPVIEEFSKSRTVISLDYSGSGETTDDAGALSLQKLPEQVASVPPHAARDHFPPSPHPPPASLPTPTLSPTPSSLP